MVVNPFISRQHRYGNSTISQDNLATTIPIIERANRGDGDHRKQKGGFNEGDFINNKAMAFETSILTRDMNIHDPYKQSN